MVDPDLTVEVIRSDGRREQVSIADAITIYERRLKEAEEEAAHCQQRIDELRKKWNKSLKGRVLRSGTSVAGTSADSGSSEIEEQ